MGVVPVFTLVSLLSLASLVLVVETLWIETISVTAHPWNLLRGRDALGLIGKNT